ncbi:MAG: hypothetical protein ACRD9R_20060, partial [Pyrinomonadaceae bacterium]
MSVEVEEIWQVMCNGEIYQADLPTLKQWIVEGLVQPGDQVRKGNLRWIEADRAPLLRRIFNGEEQVALPAEPPPPLSEMSQSHSSPQQQSDSSTVAADGFMPGIETAAGTAHGDEHQQGARVFPEVEAMTDGDARGVYGDGNNHGAAGAHAGGGAHVHDANPYAAPACHFHPQLAPEYVCRICGALLCAGCPNFVGTSKTALCPLCGDLCNRYADARARATHRHFQDSGFGLADFGAAVAYPFKNLAGLVMLVLLYGLLLLGGWRGQVAAYVVMFGCISLVIKKVAWGQMDKNFLPDFSSFSMWDDLVCPLFLGLGITIVTMGPTVVLVCALLFGWLSPAAPAMPSAADAAPGEQTIIGQNPQTQVTEAELDALLDPDGDPRQQEEAYNKLRAQQYEGIVPPQSAAADASMFVNAYTALTGSPGLVILLLLLCLGWAFCYYPMALTVAGFTEEFKAVINPFVGLDTIRRMGGTYAKAFGMYVVIQIATGIVSLVVRVIT